MRLRHSHTSPFVRKVTVLLHETGLVDRVAFDTVDGWSEPEALTGDNPLSMVPTLELDDGSSLYDSPVVCEYLDNCHDGARMIPTSGDARWRVLREQALGDGILDCAVLIFMETVKRPEDKRWDWWVDLKRRAIMRSVDRLEADADGLAGRVDLGTVSIAVALSYLDLRGAVGEWRDGHPQLAAWHAGFAARPSMQSTAPPA
ncbi:MAG: glutathione S-transferase [Gammaproteobacteria bacterium]|nr:glutathione S-transferase [Gammaproteobacteria bacterium]